MLAPYLITLHAEPTAEDALLLIDGYTRVQRASPSDFAHETLALQRAGWRGAIYALWWDSSSASDPLFQLLPPLHWHMVKERAVDAGRNLEDQIISLISKRISLVAFSLGARVAYDGLLSTDSIFKFHDLILLGGAIQSNREYWLGLISRLSGRLINCYHPSDPILDLLFRLGEFSPDYACGQEPLGLDDQRLYNLDASRLLARHGSDPHHSYWAALEDLLGAAGWPRA